MLLSFSYPRSVWLFLPATVFVLVAVVLEWAIFRATGHVLYPIDDPYIHLAMARHLVESGFFGVSLEGFSASSSAPGWTLLLAAVFRCFGSHEAVPLILNLITATALLYFVTRWLDEITQSVWAAIIGAAVFAAILPLPAIALVGMEHTLHILLILWIVRTAARLLTEPADERMMARLFFLGVSATLFRYETMFVIIPLAAIFFVQRSWRGGLLLVLSCAAPILLTGAVNLGMGWNFLPNSIVMKSALVSGDWVKTAQQIFKRLQGQLMGESQMVVPFVLSLGAFLNVARNRNPFACYEGIALFTYLSAAVMHGACASIGWFYRYEGYLLALAFLALASPAAQWFSELKLSWKNQRFAERVLSRGLLAVCLGLVLIAFHRNAASIGEIVPGAKNLFSQQYQMGVFLNDYYSGETVAANDIGVMNFLSDIHCLDMMGLGSMEPLFANRQGRWGPVFIDSWLRQHQTSVVVIYESWYRQVIPPSWIKVGEWTVSEKVTVADSTVSFFALTQYDADLLRKRLEEFTPRLPEDVHVHVIQRKE